MGLNDPKFPRLVRSGDDDPRGAGARGAEAARREIEAALEDPELLERLMRGESPTVEVGSPAAAPPAPAPAYAAPPRPAVVVVVDRPAPTPALPVGFLDEASGLLEAWDDGDAGSGGDELGAEIGRILDEEWGLGSDERGSDERRIEEPGRRLLRVELTRALDRIEAAAIPEAERRRLSRDPGLAGLLDQLGIGPLARDDRGTRRLRRGDLSGAIADYSRAVEASPGHPQPWTKRGIARARSGDLDGALRDYSRALAADRAYLPALANRASVCFHLARYRATAADATKALELAPDLAQAWLFRGMARAQLGQAEGAEQDLFHFLRLAPYSPYVRMIRDTIKAISDWDEDAEDEDAGA